MTANERRTEAGFTLVELMIVLSLFGILATAATTFLHRQTRAFDRQTEILSVRQNARAALHRLSADLRLVGRGLNNYDFEVPDLIVPNDGSVTVNTFTDSTISLLSVPDPAQPGAQLSLDPTVANNGNSTSTRIAVLPGSNLSAVGVGSRIILFDPNTGNSQVVSVTQIVADTLTFANDTLVFDFPATGNSPTQVLTLNEVSYRTNSSSGVPFLERKVDNGPWVRFIEGITSLTFTYYQGNQNPFATPTPFTPTTAAQRRSIRWIRVRLTARSIRANPGSNPVQVTETTDVVPRNMLTRN
ncbi:MAG: PilW family protein [Gemmatimonadota bacterium]